MWRDDRAMRRRTQPDHPVDAVVADDVTVHIMRLGVIDETDRAHVCSHKPNVVKSVELNNDIVRG